MKQAMGPAAPKLNGAALQQLLRCPECRGELQWGARLVCSAGHTYAVADGVAVLTPEAGATAVQIQHSHQRSYYDRAYGQFTSYRLEEWQRAYLERLAPLWEMAGPQDPFLDAGVGGSAYTVIEAARKGIPSVGCDISVEGMRTARRFAQAEGVADHCLFVVCQAERLPFADSVFAAAASIAVLEHLPEDRTAIAELARVTRGGGRVFFAVPNALDRISPILRPVYRWHDRRVGHLRHYSAAELSERCRVAGLRPLATVYSAHWIKVWQLLFHLLASKLGINDRRLWWWFEGFDARASQRDNGMHLNLFLER